MHDRREHASITRRGLLLAGAAVALAGCAPSPRSEAAAAPTPPPAPRPSPVAGAAERGALESASRFDFHIGAWLSLHHILFELGVKKSGPDAWTAPGIEAVDGSTLGANDATVWSAAIDAYRAALAKRDPVRDDELAGLHRALADRGSQPDLGDVVLPGDLRRHLEVAMPIYQSTWWKAHLAASMAWHARVAPVLSHHEDEMAVDLGRLLHQAWPDAATHVALCPYANWAGAYSTLGPKRLYVATLDARNQGTAALEILFHEAAHGLIRTVRDAIGEEAKKQSKQAKDLWHVVLFVTAGEVVRRRFPGYVPYGEREGLYAKGPWKTFRAAVESAWRPYLDGKSSFEAATFGMVAALPS
jgi:hypothetical protein